MAGDKFNVRVSMWWKAIAGTDPGQPISPLPDLIANLAAGIGAIPGNHLTTAQLADGTVLSPQIGVSLRPTA